MMKMDQETREVGVDVDLETRRRKQKTLIVRGVERQVRARARQLYDERGQAEGQALNDWIQAESEVLDGNAVAPLYRRMKSENEAAILADTTELHVETAQ